MTRSVEGKASDPDHAFYSPAKLLAAFGAFSSGERAAIERAAWIVDALTPDAALAAALVLDPAIQSLGDLAAFGISDWLRRIVHLPESHDSAGAYAIYLFQRFALRDRNRRVRAAVSGSALAVLDVLRSALELIPAVELGG